MMKMNYISEELAQTEEKLNRINNLKLNSIYVVAYGEDMQEALRNNERLLEKGNCFLQQKKVRNFSSPGTILYSDSLQQQRIERWNAWWTFERKHDFIEDFKKAATDIGFKTSSFIEFYNLIDKNYSLIDSTDIKKLQTYFYADNINASAELSTVVSVIKVDDQNKAEVVNDISRLDGIYVMDRKSILSGMVDSLSQDFNFIANVSLSLILIILIIAFGRFELGFITFIPIFLSWVWTLGIMGMAGIKFNIFNLSLIHISEPTRPY